MFAQYKVQKKVGWKIRRYNTETIEKLVEDKKKLKTVNL